VKRILAILSILLIAISTLLAQGNKEDDRIYDEVRRKLADDAVVRGAGLDVVVASGKVTLKGRVRDDKAKTKATSVAKKVKGVTNVENQLKLFSEP
jgi:osmotically-inducible protein OsmY